MYLKLNQLYKSNFVVNEVKIRVNEVKIRKYLTLRILVVIINEIQMSQAEYQMFIEVMYEEEMMNFIGH